MYWRRRSDGGVFAAGLGFAGRISAFPLKADISQCLILGDFKPLVEFLLSQTFALPSNISI